MQPSEKPAFYELLSDALGYYGKPASEFTLQVWWQACQKFSFEQITKALTAHATDAERGQFAPKVADVIRILEGTKTDRSLLAWGKVLEAIGAVGAYQDVCFDDPAIHASIADCGGWVKICRSDMAEIGYLQHRFCQSHQAYTGRGEFEYPRVLAGDRSPDGDYLKRGLPVPKPVLVGNAERAKLVYLHGGSGTNQITFQNPSDVLVIGHMKDAA